MAVFDATNSGYILVNSGLKLITPSSVDYL